MNHCCFFAEKDVVAGLNIQRLGTSFHNLKDPPETAKALGRKNGLPANHCRFIYLDSERKNPRSNFKKNAMNLVYQPNETFFHV